MIFKKVLSLTLTVFFALAARTSSALQSRDLVGTWRLQSYTILEDGKEKPWCVAPFGIISYYANGYMAVGINCRDAAGQLVANPKDMVFYTGTYDIQNGNTVVHHVENSSELSRISQHLERSAELKGDVVTLTGKGTKGLVKLVWKKIR